MKYSTLTEDASFPAEEKNSSDSSQARMVKSVRHGIRVMNVARSWQADGCTASSKSEIASF